MSHNNTALSDLYSVFEWRICGPSSKVLGKQASSPFRALVKILLEKASSIKSQLRKSSYGWIGSYTHEGAKKIRGVQLVAQTDPLGFRR